MTIFPMPSQHFPISPNSPQAEPAGLLEFAAAGRAGPELDPPPVWSAICGLHSAAFWMTKLLTLHGSLFLKYRHVVKY